MRSLWGFSILAMTAGSLAIAAVRKAPSPSVSPSPAPSPVTFQYPSRRVTPDPVWIGERHKLNVSYLGITGLRVDLEVLPTEMLKDRKVYHVRAQAVNSFLVGIFFKAENIVDSWFDFGGIFSHRLHLKQNLSNMTRDSLEEQDAIKGETTFTNHWQKKGENPNDSKATFPMARFAQDSVSAFYFLRTLPLDVGAVFKVPVVSEGNVMTVLVTVVGIDLIPYNGDKVQAFVMRLEKLDPSGVPMPGDNLIWLSADPRHYLMRAEVKTRFGHVIAKLNEFEPGTAP